MPPRVSIALIGDFDPTVVAHASIERVFEVAGPQLGIDVRRTWVATDGVGNDVTAQLAPFDGIWCVPASPYRSMAGALAAIRFAREHQRPFLGTCGGYQHALIEYARNVLGHMEADHAETNPSAAMLLVGPLSCSLVETRGAVRVLPGTRLASICDESDLTEEYHCSYGLAEQYRGLFDGSALRFSAEYEGEARAFELEGHPFFVGTMFQPERRSLRRGTIHPIVAEFMKAASPAT